MSGFWAANELSTDPNPLIAHKAQQQGFTLIEILIVVLIISIVGGIAMLTISRNQNSHLLATAKELTHYLNLAEQQAILQPAVLGMTFADNTFSTAVFNADTTQTENVWQQLPNSMLGFHRFFNNVRLTLTLKNQSQTRDDKQVPRIIFSKSGDITPFTIFISLLNSTPLYQIHGDADGSISYELVEKSTNAS